jgi:hypothetical protein
MSQFWYLGPGDQHPVIVQVKTKLGVFPIDDEFTDQLAARIRGWRKLHGEDPDDIFIDAATLQALGL